jgi:hypothetical protein
LSGELIPVAEARSRLLAGAGPLEAETIPLEDAQGRVLADDLHALRTQPPDAVSAMDGYAVRAEDLKNAPVELTVIGEVAAGHPFSGTVGYRRGSAHLHRRRRAGRRRHGDDPGECHGAERRVGSAQTKPNRAAAISVQPGSIS